MLTKTGFLSAEELNQTLIFHLVQESIKNESKCLMLNLKQLSGETTGNALHDIRVGALFKFNPNSAAVTPKRQQMGRL